jgi:hypothetical protein
LQIGLLDGQSVLPQQLALAMQLVVPGQFL